jgi:hypothetical protein
MKWSRRRTLVAGFVLIGLSNAVALGGAAYNRSGEPDSALNLTERELRPPYVWTGRKENSGLSLRLQWQVLEADDGKNDLHGVAVYGGGIPAWLNAAKMASLGFDVQGAAAVPDIDRPSPYERQLPRDVLLVLELDGPAYREALERVTNAAREMEARNERGPAKKGVDELMDREIHRSSRLFAVDAGLDRAALRSKFPDRTRYAIVHGQVRPTRRLESQAAAGFIDNASALEVNVPLEMRGAFERVAPAEDSSTNQRTGHFEARLALGQRLEPWLASASKR